MRITKNEETVVDTAMLVSFAVNYLETEVRAFYLDDEEMPMELYADCYNWETDSQDPQEGRIAIHGCGELWIDLIGNHWNLTITALEETEAEEEKVDQ